jgi:hypothetical protein
MDKIANTDEAGPESLVETNSEILEQVRKDLSQQYTRFMSCLVKERLRLRGGNTSVFDQLARPPSARGDHDA